MAITTRFFRKKVVSIKLESVYGQDAGPSASADAIETRNCKLTPLDLKMVEQNVDTAQMGHQAELPVATKVMLTFDVALTGSGAAGTAPAYGKLLRCCGLNETVFATAHSATAAAGAANTITLGATASAVDNAYNNLTITITGGTGIGQSRVIKSYVGATKVATVTEAWATPPDVTSTYSIAEQVVYGLVSSGFESATAYVYYDGNLHKLLGMRGDWNLKLDGGGIPVVSFTFTALYGGITDQAVPGNAVYTAWKTPLAVNNVNTGSFTLHGFAAPLYSLDIKGGVQVVHRDSVVGLEDVIITDRKPAGEVLLQAGLLAEKDFYTIARNLNLGALSVTHGTTAGNKVKVDAPKVQIGAPDYEDKDGVLCHKASVRLLPTSGNDELTIAVM